LFVIELLDVLLEAPERAGLAGDRREKLDALVSELYRRGLEPESLIREGVVPLMANAAIVYNMIPVVADDVPADWSYPARLGWGDLIFGDHLSAEDRRLRAKKDPSWLAETITRLLVVERPRVERWLVGLSIGDLVDWKRPTLEEYTATTAGSVPPGDGVATWLLERFTTTYLAQWATTSLHLEWKYLHADIVSPLAPREMQQRRIEEADVGRLIADRTVSGRDPARAPSIPAYKYVTVALDLLASGNRNAAVAIFDLACQADPSSAEAFNNRGFCRLPDSSAEALRDFEKAAQLGLEGDPVNLGNRMLALHRLGRNATALELAERIWPSQRRRPPAIGYMWDFTSEEHATARFSDVRAYVTSLAVHVATDAGDARAAGEWTARHKALEA
jgi:tetratricopeptide (TPR) repeat protein